MQLPVIRMPEYMSPSSFKQWQNCPLQFYFQRMAFKEYVTSPQGLPAAAGSAYDAYMTYAMAKHLKLDDRPEFSLEKLLKDSVTHPDPKALAIGQDIYNEFVRVGEMNRLLNRGINELHNDYKTTLVIDGVEVPIFIRLDMIDGDACPVEFKVNGAFSKSGTSPNPGYKYYWTNTGKYKSEHDRHEEYLEQLNVEWAQQLCIYAWAKFGMYPLRPIKARVYQTAIRGDTYAFAFFDNMISVPFQEQLAQELKHAWLRVQSKNFPEVVASTLKCHAYNTVCQFSDHCPSYKNAFGNDGSWVDAVTCR